MRPEARRARVSTESDRPMRHASSKRVGSPIVRGAAVDGVGNHMMVHEASGVEGDLVTVTDP
jgi:hypothetical protein